MQLAGVMRPRQSRSLDRNQHVLTWAIDLPSQDQMSHGRNAVWILLTDGNGDNDQCLAPAEALNVPFTAIRVDWTTSDAAHDRSICKKAPC